MRGLHAASGSAWDDSAGHGHCHCLCGKGPEMLRQQKRTDRLRRSAVGVMTCVVLMGTLLGGCVSSGPRAHLVRQPQGLGGSSEALFLPPTTEAALADTDLSAMPEAWRNDASMAIENDGPLLATSQWPTPERPSIERYRYVSMPRNAGTVLIFLPQQTWHGARGGHGGHGHWR